jgi:hypothetical protein
MEASILLLLPGFKTCTALQAAHGNDQTMATPRQPIWAANNLAMQTTGAERVPLIEAIGYSCPCRELPCCLPRPWQANVANVNYPEGRQGRQGV